MFRRSLYVTVVTMLIPAALAGQGAGGAFIVQLGDDTVAVDTYSRTGATLEGTLILRSPTTHVAHYRADLGDNDAVRRFSVRWSAASGGQVPDAVVLTASGDSATMTFTASSGETRTVTTAFPAGTVPLVSSVYSMALYDWGLRHAGTARAGTVSWVALDRRRQSTSLLAPRGRDSVAIPYFAGTYVARVDDTGRIVGLTGNESTVKIRAQRVDAGALDMEAAAANFIARDAAGNGLGAMSPRDTVRATVGSTTVLVDYSRPSARGRQIWGGVVPWDQVWRTGANAATHLVLDTDLLIGGERVPAGTYTLFTRPGRRTTMLIVNRQTGQWGTQHDPARDLVRIPLRAERPTEPVERFTISVTPAGEGKGTLGLAWGDTRYAVDVAVP